DIKDAGCDPSAVDRLNGFGEPGTGTRRRRKLSPAAHGGYRKQSGNCKPGDQALHQNLPTTNGYPELSADNGSLGPAILEWPFSHHPRPNQKREPPDANFQKSPLASRARVPKQPSPSDDGQHSRNGIQPHLERESLRSPMSA